MLADEIMMVRIRFTIKMVDCCVLKRLFLGSIKTVIEVFSLDNAKDTNRAAFGCMAHCQSSFALETIFLKDH